jgi:hypothetical protein
MELDVLISYSHADTEFVSDLRQKLEQKGYKVWTDRDIRAYWKKEIDECLLAAAVVVVIVSPQSMKSAYVTYEWSRAWFELSKAPHFLYLRDAATVGMMSRIREDQQLHPSKAILRRGQKYTSLSDTEWNGILAGITHQLERLKDFKRCAAILTGSSRTEDEKAAAETLGNAQPYDYAIACRYLVQGLKQKQLTSRANGEVQTAIVQALRKVGNPQVIPYLLKLRGHTTDPNVHLALDDTLPALTERALAVN